jgi:hypothetical protein
MPRQKPAKNFFHAPSAKELQYYWETSDRAINWALSFKVTCIQTETGRQHILRRMSHHVLCDGDAFVELRFLYLGKHCMKPSD